MAISRKVIPSKCCCRQTTPRIRFLSSCWGKSRGSFSPGLFCASSITAITLQVIASLKDYSRSSAVEYQIKGLGIASLFITGITGQAVAELAKIITAQVKKLPVWGQWAGAALIAFLILNPKSRAPILESLQSFIEGTAVAGELFFKALIPLMTEHDRAKRAAASALASIEERSILIEQKV